MMQESVSIDNVGHRAAVAHPEVDKQAPVVLPKRRRAFISCLTTNTLPQTSTFKIFLSLDPQNILQFRRSNEQTETLRIKLEATRIFRVDCYFTDFVTMPPWTT